MKKLIIASLLAVGLSACGGEEQKSEVPAAQAEGSAAHNAQEMTPAQQAIAEHQAKMEAEKNALNPLADAAALQKAEDALKALPQFAGKELNVFQDVHFYKDRIEMDVQDPNKPENIDSYVYTFDDGKWSEPSPVRLSGDGDMKPNLTPLKDIHFADVANKLIPLYKQTVEKEQITPQEDIPTFVSFILVVPTQDRFWQTSIDTDRAEMTLRMNPDGSFQALNK